MSGPPPGYNPGESMFQGGSTAPIHPVMGGGGGAGLPAGFEQQSLLHGGEGAAIHPVQGGGAGVTSDLVIEKLELTIPTKENPAFIEFDKQLVQSMNELNTLTGPYIQKQRDGIWQRYNPNQPKQVERPRILTKDNCATPSSGRLDDEKGEAGFDRLAVVLPESTEEILLFPPVQSSRRSFYACLEALKQLGMLNGEGEMKGPVAKAAEVGGAKKVIVFAPPFLIIDSKNLEGYLQTNQKLMAHFLKLKAQYPHMHILTQSTQMNKMNGNCVGAKEASSNPLLNMLEPSYVLYPFVRMQEVDDPTDLLGISKKKEPRGGIIFSAASANEVTLPASNLPSRVASPSVYIQKGGRSAVAYLPNTKKEDADINRMYAPIRYRFYGEGKVVLLPTEVQRFFVQPSPAEVAQTATGGDTTLFQATPEQYLTLDNVTYTRVPLDGRVYAFRAPGARGVMEDWKGGRFTDDEAKFLNQLQLRTNTLEKIFPEEETQMKPMERVAEFLRVMVMGRCFTDERLLTATECQDSRDFVNRVYTYYLMHNEVMEELKDAEEEARKRSARLRLETAEGRMQAAQRAERQRAAELDAELQKIRDNAKEIGVDLVRESGDFLKNPVGPDGPVREATKVGFMRPPDQDARNKNKHILQVIVFKRKASTDEKTGHSYIDYWTGKIDFTVGEGEDITIRAQQELEKLNRDYPGYYFVQDFD